MIYAIVGTSNKEREKAFASVAKFGEATSHIYSEQIVQLEPLIESASLFGDKIIVHIIQGMDVAASRDELIRLLPMMEKSDNIFIIDEPFADANRVKRLEKYAKKLFDARDLPAQAGEKNNVFGLCNLVARRDKKGAWVEWMKFRDKESHEAIHGALWWKFSNIWQDTKKGVATKFTLDECESLGKRLMRSSLEAHRGKKDLGLELEAIILSL